MGREAKALEHPRTGIAGEAVDSDPRRSVVSIDIISCTIEFRAPPSRCTLRHLTRVTGCG